MSLVDGWLSGLKKAPILTSERLVLRPITAGDAAFIQASVDDKRVCDNLSYTPHPYTMEMAETWVKNVNFGMTNNNCCYWTICENNTQVPVGSMGISIFREQEGAEMHYWINANFWNKGYCSEAAKRTISHVFDTLKAHRLAITHREHNIASKRVIEKCGFIFEGEERDGLKRHGTFENVLRYSMLYDDYVRAKQQWI